MRRALLGLALLVTLATPTLAVEPSERLADPVLEARARAVGQLLRCLVCQNESVDESGASLAHDIRVLLRERIAAGDSDAQAIQYLVDRYGEFVLLKPRVEPATYALWFGPLLILVVAGGALLVCARKRTVLAPPAPLDPAEQEKLQALLRDGEG